MTLLECAGEACSIFLVGAIGGSVYYFVKGSTSSSSRGCRLAGGVQAVITNGRRVGRGAAWFAVLAFMEKMLYERNVPVGLKQTLTWGTANALFSLDKGKPAAVRSGLKGAAWGAAVGIAFWSLNAAVQYAVESL